jgi:TolB-like protein
LKERVTQIAREFSGDAADNATVRSPLLAIPFTAPMGDALERGRANHSAYILSGTVDGEGSAQVLSVKIAAVANGSVLWSKSYPASGADPAKIAAEVDSKVPSFGDD